MTEEIKCGTKPTIEQLQAVEERRQAEFRKQQEEYKRINLAVQNYICPECGCKIISQTTEVLEKPKKYLFGLIVIREKIWGYRTICSSNKSHYERKGFYSDDCYY